MYGMYFMHLNVFMHELQVEKNANMLEKINKNHQGLPNTPSLAPALDPGLRRQPAPRARRSIRTTQREGWGLAIRMLVLAITIRENNGGSFKGARRANIDPSLPATSLLCSDEASGGTYKGRGPSISR